MDEADFAALERLHKLHGSGALTAEEFAEQKSRVLGGKPPLPRAEDQTFHRAMFAGTPPLIAGGRPTRWLLVGAAAVAVGVLLAAQLGGLFDREGEQAGTRSSARGVSIQPVAETNVQEHASPAAAPNSSPSFDCRRASTSVERMICADPTLADKDRRVAAWFSKSLSDFPDGRAYVIADQRAWLGERNRCTNSRCVHMSYNKRLLLLQWAEQNSSCRGGSGDQPETLAACDRREKLDAQLSRLGMCYGREGEFGNETEWHVCGEGSIGANNKPIRALNPQTAEGAKTLASVPAKFRGEWNRSPDACGRHEDDSEMVLAANSIAFWESDGPITKIVQIDPHALILTARLSGEGETWTTTMRFRLSKDGQALTEIDSDNPFERRRC